MVTKGTFLTRLDKDGRSPLNPAKIRYKLMLLALRACSTGTYDKDTSRCLLVFGCRVGQGSLRPFSTVRGSCYGFRARWLPWAWRRHIPIPTVLHNFANLTKGANPYARVIRDPAGNLYGTTYNGGKSNAGVVFKVSASGQEAVLHSFTGGADGADPRAGVIEDSSGNLYGTTCYGDTANAGVVFKVAASGPETVLYTFTGGSAGANPFVWCNPRLVRKPLRNHLPGGARRARVWCTS